MKRSSLGIGIVVLLLAAIIGCGEIRSFGRNPNGEELARIDTFPNYKNGAFENLAELEGTA